MVRVSGEPSLETCCGPYFALCTEISRNTIFYFYETSTHRNRCPTRRNPGRAGYGAMLSDDIRDELFIYSSKFLNYKHLNENNGYQTSGPLVDNAFDWSACSRANGEANPEEEQPAALRRCQPRPPERIRGR